MDSSIDWQNTFTTNDLRVEYIFKEKKCADCKFLVGVESDQEEFSGHKLILSMASPVFETMFYGSLPETSDLIKIPDINPKIFQFMMEHIYLQKLILTSIEDAFELSYAAKKYSLKNLDEKCMTYMKENLQTTNVCQIYEFAELYSENNLKEECKEHISKHTTDVLQDKNFLSVKLSTVLMILDQNELKIESELVLFNALHDYAVTNGYISNTNNEQQLEAISNEASTEQVDEHFEKDNDKDKALIKEAVKKIRFLSMTPDEFSIGPAKSQLLTDCEGYSILLNISSPKQGIHKMPDGFCLIKERIIQSTIYCSFCQSFHLAFKSRCTNCNHLFVN